MREIEFKAKQKGNGKWVYGFPYIDYDTKTLKIQNTKGDIYNCRYTTLCEYTGVKDIDGNKIYEHDVVIHKCGALHYKNKYYLNVKIQTEILYDSNYASFGFMHFDDIKRYFKNKEIFTSHPLHEDPAYYYKIIGNSMDMKKSEVYKIVNAERRKL